MFWSIIGYFSSILVLISLMFKNPFKFRVMNAAGAFIASVYSYISGAYPMSIMNAGIFLIDLYFIFSIMKEKRAASSGE